MHLRRLAVTDFRSWESAELDLAPGITVLVGPNGVGKTNLVEAAATWPRSVRTASPRDAPLIRRGAERAVVRGQVVHLGRELSVELEITPGRANRARVNRAPVPRPATCWASCARCCSRPEDLALVRGDPGERRRFLDDLLVARYPRFAAVRADYDRVLQASGRRCSRPPATRRSRADLRTLDVWDGHLARHGAALLAGRLELVAALAAPAVEAFAEVAPSSAPIALVYRSSLDGVLPDTARRAGAAAARRAGRGCVARRSSGGCVSSARTATIWSCGSATGPAKGYASHGESWALALALRLASYRLLCADGVEPVLILDDVFAELDARRRRALAGVAARAEQVLVTAAVEEDVPAASAASVCGERRPDRACSAARRRPPRQCLKHDRPRAVDKVVDTVDNFGWTGDEQRKRPSAGPHRPPAAGDRAELSPGLGTRIDRPLVVTCPLASANPDSPSDARSRSAEQVARERCGGARAGQRAASPASAARGRAGAAWSGPGPDDRDPQPFGRLVARVSLDRGWSPRLTDATVLGRWPQLVGADIADHCTPLSLRDGELVLQAESTAWATQLRTLSRQLLTGSPWRVGKDVVRRIRVVGPSGPIWRHGPRHVRGRGPRDTYG